MSADSMAVSADQQSAAPVGGGEASNIQNTRAEIVQLQAWHVSSEDRDMRVNIRFTQRLHFYATFGRTAWIFMTEEEREHLVTLASEYGEDDEFDREYIKPHLQRLLEVNLEDFAVEPVEDRVFDVDQTALIEGTINLLWTLVLSGKVFFIKPPVTTYGPPLDWVIDSVQQMLKSGMNLTTQYEVLTLARVVFPAVAFKIPDNQQALQVFSEQLGEQLEADGLLDNDTTWSDPADYEDIKEMALFPSAATFPSVERVCPDQLPLHHERDAYVTVNPGHRTLATAQTSMVGPHPAAPIGGLGEYSDFFPNLARGAADFYRIQRTISVTGTDNVAFVKRNSGRFVKELYTATITPPHGTDPLQQRMMNFFERQLNNVKEEEREPLLMGACCAIVQQVINLHTLGDNLRPDQDITTGEENTMKARTRPNHIISALEDTKTLAVDIMSGLDKIAVIVAAPITSEKVKYRNAKTNETKGGDLAEMKRQKQARQQAQQGTTATQAAANPLAALATQAPPTTTASAGPKTKTKTQTKTKAKPATGTKRKASAPAPAESGRRSIRQKTSRGTQQEENMAEEADVTDADAEFEPDDAM